MKITHAAIATPRRQSEATGKQRNLASSQAPARSASPAAGSGPAHSLTQSIMQDGGLAFLQGRLEEKLAATVGRREGSDQDAGAPEQAASYGAGGTDLTPEAVADRIVSFALGLRGAYDRQNQDLSAEERQSGFEAEVRRGIGDGFSHARQVLDDLGLNDDRTRATTDRTWTLIQEKLDAHFGSAGEEADPAEAISPEQPA